ncbi:hypothetical protein PSE_3694 [Pseudovibrio sp. FO-BEG1]|uniref:hypothetical protein n=1 Tax=Pseudovibrio sp. (strain FO-BEG1) TaxID=911045 RepID=UPI000238BE02|nr:hypothetical protein [Pseudovibrio sp. FO-BEG1]AEV38198.1 hypothetical protein PSE_3694 [Pseudovibrio sp. FO-BEG1]
MIDLVLPSRPTLDDLLSGLLSSELNLKIKKSDLLIPPLKKARARSEDELVFQTKLVKPRAFSWFTPLWKLGLKGSFVTRKIEALEQQKLDLEDAGSWFDFVVLIENQIKAHDCDVVEYRELILKELFGEGDPSDVPLSFGELTRINDIVKDVLPPAPVFSIATKMFDVAEETIELGLIYLARTSGCVQDETAEEVLAEIMLKAFGSADRGSISASNDQMRSFKEQMKAWDELEMRAIARQMAVA